MYEHVSHSVLGTDTYFAGPAHTDNRTSGADSLKTFSTALTQMHSALERIPRFWKRVCSALDHLRRQHPPFKISAKSILKITAWQNYGTQMSAAQSSLSQSRDLVRVLTPASEGSNDYSQMYSSTKKAHDKSSSRANLSPREDSGKKPGDDRPTKDSPFKTTPPSASVKPHKPNWFLRLLGFK